MNFEVYVPCNCRERDSMRVPPFMDKLEIVDGLYEIRAEYMDDDALEQQFESWKFCEHYQLGVRYSITHNVLGWKRYISEKYEDQFPNFLAFIPEHHDWVNTAYDKREALREIDAINQLEEFKHQKRFKQFKDLLNTAIQYNKEIYWV